MAATVPFGMSEDGAIRRHFGKLGEPENALIVLNQRFGEVAA